jgi:hypothetical protein
MGYTHYWHQSRPFTAQEWVQITAEAKRIVAKAMRGYYAGPETAETAAATVSNPIELAPGVAFDNRHGFGEKGAWRTFAHNEISTPEQGKPIALCGPGGKGQPEFTAKWIAFNGSAAKGEDYESFALERRPKKRADETESFAFTKTEYRPYDPVVVSVLAAARQIAPNAIRVKSDGGDEAIRLLF